MKIVKFKMSNFMSVTEAELVPGKINQFVGANNQGKTTWLTGLETTLKGSTDGSLVKNGADFTELVIELADGTIVKRRIKADGKQTLTVQNGMMKPAAPQAFLEAMFDYSAFNPLELLDPKKRNDAILNSIDLKVDADTLSKSLNIPVDKLPELSFDKHGLKVVEEARDYYFKRRAEANKDAATKKARWETYKKELPNELATAPDKEKIQAAIEYADAQIAACDANIEKIKNIGLENEKAQQTVDKYIAAAAEIQEDVDKLFEKLTASNQTYNEKHKEILERHRKELIDFDIESNIEIADLKQKLASESARVDQSKIFIEQAKEQVLETLPSDEEFVQAKEAANKVIAELRVELEACKTYEAQKKSFELVADLEKDYLEAIAFADELTAQVEALAGPIKRGLMENAEMPIKGLTFSNGTFLVDDVPVDHLSSSKALRLAVGVARKHAKKTKLICIDGAELLDEESWAEFVKETKDDGFTYFVTKVGPAFDGGDSVTTMSEGKIS
jgi:hypothetical protein